MRFPIAAVSVLAGLSCLCRGIIIRDDKQDSDYVVAASSFPAVFAYPGNQGKGANCAATLIDATHAVTAAHCFSEGSPKPPFSVVIDGTTHSVTAAYVNPCFDFEEDGPNGADLAVLVLASASSVTPYARYPDADEVGKTIMLVGWGDTGPAGGSTPAEGNGGELLRRGNNVIEETTGNVLKYTMDSPSDGALTLEAMGWSGDSGGPAFITKGGTTYIAGVNSGGDCCNYGSSDQFARLSTQASRTWIDQSISQKKAAPFSISGGASHDSCTNDDDGASFASESTPSAVIMILCLFVVLQRVA